jgi:hypothetical protein
MTALSWEETPLSKHHDRAAFDCDDTDLNRKRFSVPTL